VILDTCALLWLAEGGRRLSAAARKGVGEAPFVAVVTITGFEIGLKVRQGKLVLPAPTTEWLDTILEHHALGVLPLDLRVCVAATELPLLHRDPCDRLIIATAKLERMPVVTADPRFASYGIEVIW
jgi:PIN domain nuclease of toxin-antitoxin system